MGRKKVNEKKLVKFYSDNPVSLRDVSNKFRIDHHRVKRILQKNDIVINRRKKRKFFSKETRRKMSDAQKELFRSGKKKMWSAGKKMTREHNIKNMRAHLKYNVSFEWLNSFPDIEKLKFLNRSLSRERDYDGFDTRLYMAFIERFYYDVKFNLLFDKWEKTGDKYIKPSLDHIVAKSSGGKLNDLNNLQFISWLENRAKVDIEYDIWNTMKKNILWYL